jgi:hypothetical protein
VAAVSVLPDEGCPAARAIEANLDRLGVLSSLAQLGGAEVRVQEPSLQISFRDHRGESLGLRVVAASPDCAARATLAAAVIASFTGSWAQTKLAPPPSASMSPPAPLVGVPASAKPSTERPWQTELGALAFGIHDGDAGTFGLGARADVGRGAWMATMLVEGSWPRERPLGGGQGDYRFLRAGIGPGIRAQGSHFFWDGSVLAMIDRLALQGNNLSPGRTANDWEFTVAGTTRLGWNGRRTRPFLFVEVSYSTPSQNMTLTGSNVTVPLSQINVEAGLGISLGILP